MNPPDGNDVAWGATGAPGRVALLECPGRRWDEWQDCHESNGMNVLWFDGAVYWADRWRRNFEYW